MDKKQTPCVGIITLFGLSNYGNRLQNYALQEVLLSMGCQVQTVVYYESYSNTLLEKLKALYRLPFKDNLNRISRLLNRLFAPSLPSEFSNDSKLIDNRVRNFQQFNQKIITTSFTVRPNDLSFLSNSNFDFFIVGSDQVWNPYSRGSKIEFLTFAPPESRISYAASFGVDNLHFRFRNRYRNWLMSMTYLSVREKEGQQIVHKLTGKEAKVHLDPTMLLTVEKWRTVMRADESKPSKPYLVTYFLGSVSNKQRQLIRDCSERENLEIVNLGDFSDPIRYVIGPEKFIDFINDAAMVITDSFHGLAFSVLFQRPYLIVKRAGEAVSGFSRIKTLLEKFSLPVRYLEEINESYSLAVDFSQIQHVLDYERKSAREYLAKALNVSY